MNLPDSSARLYRFSRIALWLLAFILPFEADVPWLAIGPVALTNVEIVLAFCLLGGALLWWRYREPGLRPFPRWWLGLLGWFIFALILSGLLTAEFRGVAFKAILRTMTGVLLTLAVPQIVRTKRDLIGLVIALVTGGLVATLIGLLEFSPSFPAAWLEFFRIAPTMAGPFLRLTGPFDFANQAAMYIEGTLPLLLALIWLAWANGRRPWFVVAVIAGLIYLEAAFLTFSRTSFVTLLVVAVGMALLLGVGTTPSQKRQVPAWATLAALIVLLIPLNLLLSPTFQLRLSSEGDNEWYEARIDVPQNLQVDVDEVVTIPVTITNDGALVWDSVGGNPVVLSASWVQPKTNLEWDYKLRWPLEKSLAPGEEIAMDVPVQTPPQDGEYLLTWDLVQEGIVWFGTKNGTLTRSQVKVGDVTESQATTNNMSLVQARPIIPPIPGRVTLWRIAGNYFTQHPLLGIGLDNFRLIYGRELDYTDWNTSIHTNSWYVETLVSVGFIGAVPFFAWLGLMVLRFVRTLRRPTVTIWQTAVVRSREAKSR
jgi:hypothetical protein